MKEILLNLGVHPLNKLMKLGEIMSLSLFNIKEANYAA